MSLLIFPMTLSAWVVQMKATVAFADKPEERSGWAELVPQVRAERFEVATLVTPSRHRPGRGQDVGADELRGQVSAYVLEQVMCVLGRQLRESEHDLRLDLSRINHDDRR